MTDMKDNLTRPGAWPDILAQAHHGNITNFGSRTQQRGHCGKAGLGNFWISSTHKCDAYTIL